MKKHLYLLALRRDIVDSLHFFYAHDEQEAQQKAERIQTSDERLYGAIFQRVELRPCPHGFVAGLRTYYPPTQECEEER